MIEWNVVFVNLWWSGYVMNRLIIGRCYVLMMSECCVFLVKVVMLNVLCSYFLSDLVIDLGIVNILIYVCGKGIVIDEFLVVVVCIEGVYGIWKLVLVVGVVVKEMLGWMLGNILVI